MADETVVVDLKVIDNMEPSIANLKELKKLLKTLPADSENFGTVNRAVGDMEDSIKSAKGSTSDLVDTLASAPGPLGAFGKGLNSIKVAFTSFNGALKASIIGVIVGTIGLLVTAFAKTEGSLKKLDPLLIGLEKMLGGIVEGMQPLLDIFLDLALKALPYVVSGVKNFFGALVGLFTLVKEVGVGAAKVLKGLFTFDYKLANEGYEQIKGSWDKTKVAFNQFTANFETGYAKQTATQKKNLKEQKEAADKAYDEAVKRADAQDKLDDARIEKAKALALAIATTEQQKLDIEVQFAKITYDAQKKNLEDRIALNKKFGKDTVQLQADLIKLETTFINTQAANAGKQKEIYTKSLDDRIKSYGEYRDKQVLEYKKAFNEESFALNNRRFATKMSEEAYQAELLILRDKFNNNTAEENALAYNKDLDLLNSYLLNKQISQVEFNDRKKALDKEYNAAEIALNEQGYAEAEKRLAQVTALEKQQVESQRELNQIRLDSYQLYADGLAAIFNYISSVQRDGTNLQADLAKAAVYIQAAVAAAQVILKGRQAFADYSAAGATAAANIIAGKALSSNPITAPIGIAMVATGIAAKAAAKAGQIATVAGGIAQLGIIASNAGQQINAIEAAKNGARASAASSGGSGGGYIIEYCC